MTRVLITAITSVRISTNFIHKVAPLEHLFICAKLGEDQATTCHDVIVDVLGLCGFI